MMSTDDHRAHRRAVVLAGHRGDTDFARAALAADDGLVRASALTALDRSGALAVADILGAFDDPDPVVRCRAATHAGARPGVELDRLLDDADPNVVEVAAWACGEQEHVATATLDRLISLTTGAEDPLVREAAAAALGAIGDDAGLEAVLVACTDKPAIRRRAVLALAPFDGPAVDAAIEQALTDRDWQVRQAAEDLRRATGELDV